MAFPVVNGIRSIEFGTRGPSREKLNALVLDGPKRATAGHLARNYEAEGEPVEHVGELLAMLNSAGEHVATLKVTRVEVLRFADVPDEFVIAEGEGETTAEEFREGYRKDWTAMGFEINDDTLVVNLYFDLVEDLR